MSQIIVVKDSTNNKLRELESNSGGELKVAVSALPTPAGVALESSLSSLNGKVSACNTGAVVVSGSALPAGAATQATLATALGELESMQTNINAIAENFTACDTGAVVVSGSALPTGAATEVSAGACATSLATLAGAVTSGVVQVSGHPTPSSSASTVYNAVSNAGSATAKSASKDVDAYRSVCIMGTSSVSSGTVEIEVSNDNSVWFELNNHFISVDMTSGDFGINLDMSAKYVRLSRTNPGGSSETITAIISAK